MAAQNYCDVCDMPFDWEGVRDGDALYCCDACARGEPCTCPGHQHADVLQTMDAE